MWPVFASVWKNLFGRGWFIPKTYPNLKALKIGKLVAKVRFETYNFPAAPLLINHPIVAKVSTFE